MVHVDAGSGNTGHDSISVFRLSDAEPASSAAVLRSHDVSRRRVFRPVVRDDASAGDPAHAFRGDITTAFRANVDRSWTRPPAHGHDQRLLGAVIGGQLLEIRARGRWRRQRLGGCTLYVGRTLVAQRLRGYRKACGGKLVGSRVCSADYSEYAASDLRTLIIAVIVFKLRVVTGTPMRFSTWLR